MTRIPQFSKMSILSAVVLGSSVVLMSLPAAAGIKTVDGQSYWTGDPGPVDPGAFYRSGQERFDPHHYLSYYGSEPQDYVMTVHAPHSGNTRCVWRRRVVNSNWEFHHPYIRVCN